MRVLLTGGGTAGHINPALAIAETVKQNDPSAVIAFVGTKRGIESDLIPREGYPLYFVESKGFCRPLLHPQNISAAWMAVRSPYAKKTVDVIKEFNPDIVIGTGGYACWPIAAAAIRMGIPCALHESNASPGLAIKRLHRRADRVWLHFEETAKKLSSRKNVLCVGNPLRAQFGAMTKEEARNRLGISKDCFFILSFGGSIGAQAVDRAILELMSSFSSKTEDVIHIHAAGKRGIDQFLDQMRDEGLEGSNNCIAKDYIYDMPLQMAAADLVICRAGAMTLSELAKLKKAAILIPSPNVTDNHQYFNAKLLSDANAAVLIEERELKARPISETVVKLYQDRKALCRIEEAIGEFGKTDANKVIWEDILKLLKDRKNKKL